MGATAEGRPEVSGKCADISPRGTGHRYVVGALLVTGYHVEAVHGHRSGTSFHLTALPSDLVESPATNPDRRHHGRNLLDLANERPCGGHHLVRIHGRHVVNGGHLARGVQRRCLGAQDDPARLLLGQGRKEAEQAGGPTHTENQDPGGVGVQRP